MFVIIYCTREMEGFLNAETRGRMWNAGVSRRMREGCQLCFRVPKVIKAVRILLEYEASSLQFYHLKQFFQATFLQKGLLTCVLLLFWAANFDVNCGRYPSLFKIQPCMTVSIKNAENLFT